ncbi:MAG: formate dehydrogenase subunit delta [Geminicoccaceae bacterium]
MTTTCATQSAAAVTSPVVRMANQIAAAFAAEADPIAATAAHIAAFWDPRMRAQLCAAVAEDTAGLLPVALAAARRLESSS